MKGRIIDIKGIIFDYGGTLDSRGVHWSEIIWDGYKACGVNIGKQLFRDAYVYAERWLAKEPLVEPTFNFYDLMHLKIELEFSYLHDVAAIGLGAECAKAVAAYCYDKAKRCVAESRVVLEKVGEKFPMVLVSNFYGNLRAVLADYGILNCFVDVVESAVVGIRKPDAGIFRLGVERLGLNPSEVLVVGDSYSKDIQPAMQLGCKTVWLEGQEWEKTSENAIADYKITKLEELLDAVL